MVEMAEPYIPGFLAFREVGFLLQRLEMVKHDCPHLMPQVGTTCDILNGYIVSNFPLVAALWDFEFKQTSLTINI